MNEREQDVVKGHFYFLKYVVYCEFNFFHVYIDLSMTIYFNSSFYSFSVFLSRK